MTSNINEISSLKIQKWKPWKLKRPFKILHLNLPTWYSAICVTCGKWRLWCLVIKLKLEHKSGKPYRSNVLFTFWAVRLNSSLHAMSNHIFWSQICPYKPPKQILHNTNEMIKIVLVLAKKGDGLLTGSTVFGFKMSDGRCLAADLHRDAGTFAADTSCFEAPSELLRRLLVALPLGVGVLLLWTTGEGVFLPLETTSLRSPCSNAEAIFLLTNLYLTRGRVELKVFA